MAPSKIAFSKPRFNSGSRMELRFVKLGHLGIKIPDDLVADLDALCKAYGIDRETAVRRALDAYPESDSSMALMLYTISHLRDVSLSSGASVGDADSLASPTTHRTIN